MRFGHGNMGVSGSHGLMNTNHAAFNNDFQSASVAAVTDLSEEDIDILVQMYQEEKLARDVYDAMAEQYDLAIFDRISDSEQRHLDTVESILVNNGVDISDLQSLEPGEFKDEDFQNLYNDLVTQGSESLEDALNVGISVEELDINDLQDYIESDYANVALVGVFSNLDAGSEHHLAAFNQVLDNYDYIA